MLIIKILFSACKPSALLIKERKIDAIFSAYNSDSKPGASVLVYQNDKIVFQKGYGVKELTNFEKIDPYTNFRLASVTKQFTAMSILLLAKNNKLSLEDPLTKYFSSFPAYGKKIKIKHLLTHSSGLVDYEDLMPATQTTQLHDTNCLQLMYMVDSLYFPAGTKYKYSNTGYSILALIVEKVTGKDFATYLKEVIFKPLGMNNTFIFSAKVTERYTPSYNAKMQPYRLEKYDCIYGDKGDCSAVTEISELMYLTESYSQSN